MSCIKAQSVSRDQVIQILEKRFPDPTKSYCGGIEHLNRMAQNHLDEVKLDPAGEYLMVREPSSQILPYYLDCIWKLCENGNIKRLMKLGGDWTSLTMDHIDSILLSINKWVDRFYQYQLVTNNRYVCNSHGHKELSLAPKAMPFDECRPYQSWKGPLTMEIVINLADSDLLCLLKAYTVDNITAFRARQLMKLILDSSQWEVLRQTQELEAYLTRVYNPYELFLRDVSTKAFNLRPPPSYEYLYEQLDLIISVDFPQKEVVPSVIDLFSWIPRKKSEWITDLFYGQIKSMRQYKNEVRMRD